MSVDVLLQQFTELVEAPNFVFQLRRLVLDLAMRGQLVDQDAADEPAAELLDRISEEKAKHIGARRVSPTPRPAEPPFVLPSTWAWSTIGEIGIVSPRNDAPDEIEAAFVPMRLIPAEYGVPSGHEVRTWSEVKRGYSHFAEGDVALAKITPCFENGKSTVFRGLTGALGAGTTELHVVRPVMVSPDYLLAFLKSRYFIEGGIPLMTGTAGQKRVPRDYFESAPLPLPPLAEQARIVERIKDFMALCDELEAGQGDRELRRCDFIASSLYHLAPDPADEEANRQQAFDNALDLVLQNITDVTSHESDVERLRTMLLQLAIRGKLEDQLSDDEPAEMQVARIRSTHERQLELGTVRPPKGRPNAALLEDIGNLPAGWQAVTLSELLTVINGRAYKKEELLDVGPLPVLRVGNLFTSDRWFYSDLELDDDKHCDRGDLLYAWSASFGPFIWSGDRAIFHYHIWKLRLHDERETNKTFIYYWLLAKTGEIRAAGHGISMVHMTKAKMENLPVLLPPKAEQDRIVERLDEAMNLCNLLEQDLASVLSQRSRLASLALRGVL